MTHLPLTLGVQRDAGRFDGRRGMKWLDFAPLGALILAAMLLGLASINAFVARTVTATRTVAVPCEVSSEYYMDDQSVTHDLKLVCWDTNWNLTVPVPAGRP